MIDQRLLGLIGGLSDASLRIRNSKLIAESLGAEDLIIFSRDPILQVYLPLPGFPQTLPEGKRWMDFLQRCEEGALSHGEITSPFTRTATPVLGMVTPDHSVLTLLGGTPLPESIREFSLLVPIIVSALGSERLTLIAQGELEAEFLQAEKMKVLAGTLDETRRSLERELQKSRSVLNSITDAFFAIDSEMKIVEVNSQFERLTRTPRHELLDMAIGDVFPEFIGNSYRLQYESALRSQRPTYFEEYLARSECWYEIRLYPSKDGLAVYLNDINERKSSEKRLHAAISERDRSLETLAIINKVGQRLTSELNFESLVQQITEDAARLTGAQSAVFLYNSLDSEGHQRVFRVTHGMLDGESFAHGEVGNPIELSLFPDPRRLCGNEAGQEEVRRLLDLIFQPLHGEIGCYLSMPVISRTGEVLGGLFLGHEDPDAFSDQAERISEGLSSQAAIALDNARLYRSVQESVRARDEFLSIASHELKTPLTSLKLQTQVRGVMLSRKEMNFFNEERLKKMVETDTRQLDRLIRLVDDMLDISRARTGKLPLRPEPLCLGKLVQEIVERHASQIQDKKVSVKTEIHEEIIGNWDSFRIEQVITNLLTNALKYGRQLPVTIVVRRSGKEALVEVSDQGIGILPESRERIFERFERAISANEISGLGLGLFIARQIVEMHHGSIEVQSELGKGSKFTVRLPLS